MCKFGIVGSSGPGALSPTVMASIQRARDKITVVTRAIRISAQALDASEDGEIGDLSPMASGLNWV